MNLPVEESLRSPTLEEAGVLIRKFENLEGTPDEQLVQLYKAYQKSVVLMGVLSQEFMPYDDSMNPDLFDSRVISLNTAVQDFNEKLDTLQLEMQSIIRNSNDTLSEVVVDTSAILLTPLFTQGFFAGSDRAKEFFDEKKASYSNEFGAEASDIREVENLTGDSNQDLLNMFGRKAVFDRRIQSLIEMNSGRFGVIKHMAYVENALNFLENAIEENRENLSDFERGKLEDIVSQLQSIISTSESLRR
ncbi:MAG: hypothetical protein ABI721_03970 [Candidatus Dojkabacteria bacterium]